MLIYLLIIVGGILTIIGIPLVKPVASLIGANGHMLDLCTTYGKTILIFLIPFVLQNSFQSFLIVAERPTFGLIISIITGVFKYVSRFYIYICF